MGSNIFTQCVVNPLLTYVASGVTLHSSGQATKAACRDFYTLDELLDAKSLLWEVGDPEILGEMHRRRTSVKGDEMDKVLDDIINGIKKLSAADKLPLFTVDGPGLARIPKAAPHESLPISLCERVNALESLMQTMMEKFCAMQQCKSASSVGWFPPSASSMPPKDPRSASQKPVGVEKPSMADLASRLSDDDFTEVKRPQSKNKRQKRPPPGKGKAKAKTESGNSSFKGGPMTFKLALTNVDPASEEQSIKDYITHTNKDVSPIQVEDKSTDGWTTKRFIITFKRTDEEKVMTPEFWPEGVYFRQWYSPRSRARSDATNHDG